MCACVCSSLPGFLRVHLNSNVVTLLQLAGSCGRGRLCVSSVLPPLYSSLHALHLTQLQGTCSFFFYLCFTRFYFIFEHVKEIINVREFVNSVLYICYFFVKPFIWCLINWLKKEIICGNFWSICKAPNFVNGIHYWNIISSFWQEFQLYRLYREF